MRKAIVLKFGGASVATPESFHAVADLVLQRLQEYPRLVVVVSAMKGTTDQLINLARQVHSRPPERELDMLVSVGERISISLLAMALDRKGHAALSFTGSQSGIVTTSDHTNALILDVRPQRLLPYLDAGRVVIVAGFQGVSESKEITTLGRGGSDTTAVALGVSLGAERVEFFKDVGGIYSADPRRHSASPLLPRLTYEEALRVVAESEHAVLHPRCIALAAKNGLPLRVLGFDPSQKNEGTWIGESAAVRPPSHPLYEGHP